MSSLPSRTPSPELVSSGPPRTLPARFVDFWWITIPARLRAYSTLLWGAWSDGVYLTAWPRLAMMLVLAAFLFGFAEGATHWSWRTIVGTNGISGNVLAPSSTADNWGGPTRLVFAENLVLLVVAVVLGSLSANLGVVLVIGYALGDLLHGLPTTGPGWRAVDPLNGWIYRHVPLLVSYLLFFLLAAMPILMATELARSSHPRVRRSKSLTVALTALIEGMLIYCWGYMAPMVFRTVWLWSGGGPRITVPFYAQVTATWLAPAAVIAVVVRGLLFRAGIRRQPVVGRIAALAAQVLQARRRVPAWVRVILVAGIITLLMTGYLHTPSNYDPPLLTNFGEAELIFLGLAGFLLASVYLLPALPAWQRWTTEVNEYPAVLRLAAATAGSYVLCRIIVGIPGAQSTRPGEFGPEVAAILVGIVISVLLLPNGWFLLPRTTRVLPRLRAPKLTPAAQASIVVCLLLLATRKAFGDCWDSACCMAGLPGVAAGAAAGTVPGLGGAAAASGPASAAAGSGEPWWKKAANALGLGDKIPLGGGFHINTDKPGGGWGGEAEVGSRVTAGASVDVGVAPGSDPGGPLIDINAGVTVQVHPPTEGPGIEVGVHDHASVSINPNVQQAVKSQGGGSAAQQVINEMNNMCDDGSYGNCGN